MTNPSTQSSAETTAPDRNSRKIQQMFAEIAGRYDFTNSFLSMGIHHLWKRRLLRELKKELNQASSRILDCACGSGDISFLLSRDFASEKDRVLGMDFCVPMLEVAEDKRKSSPNATLDFSAGDATRLPLSDSSFDAVTISFGIRNVVDRPAAYREFERILNKKGTLAVLEFGQPTAGWFRALFNWYSTTLLPVFGGVLTGKPEAYSYLEATSASFPCGPSFVDEVVENSEFRPISHYPLTGGIAWLYLFSKGHAED